MNVSDAEAGRVLDLGDRLEARLERIIDHDRREVWRMLTDPAALVNWLAPAEIDARKGGRIHIDFPESGAIIDSRIVEFDPPGLLAYSWSSGDEPERPLRWQLESLGTETRLALTLRLPGDEDIATDAHIEMRGPRGRPDPVPGRSFPGGTSSLRQAAAALKEGT